MGVQRRWRWVQRRRLRMGADDGWKMIFFGGRGVEGGRCGDGNWVFWVFIIIIVQGSCMGVGVG